MEICGGVVKLLITTIRPSGATSYDPYALPVPSRSTLSSNLLGVLAAQQGLLRKEAQKPDTQGWCPTEHVFLLKIPPRPKYLALTAGLVLMALGGTAACGEIALPEPAPPHQEKRDERIQPEAKVQVKYGFPLPQRANTMRLKNHGAFAWTPLDDIRLMVRTPTVEVGGYIIHPYTVELRCPAPKTIPSGAEIEIPFDACLIATNEPGPRAMVSHFRLVAREGYIDTAFGGGVGPQVNSTSKQ